MYTISQKAYQQVQQETEAGQATGEASSADSTTSEDKKDDDVIDAEYTKE